MHTFNKDALSIQFLTEGGDGESGGRSKFNTWEAQYAVGLAQYLILQQIKPGRCMYSQPRAGVYCSLKVPRYAMASSHTDMNARAHTQT